MFVDQCRIDPYVQLLRPYIDANDARYRRQHNDGNNEHRPAMSTITPTNAQTAFVLCGALAREVIAIARRHGWDVALFGVAAKHHMRPIQIAPDVERRLRDLLPRFARIVVVYGDCGSA